MKCCGKLVHQYYQSRSLASGLFDACGKHIRVSKFDKVSIEPRESRPRINNVIPSQQLQISTSIYPLIHRHSTPAISTRNQIFIIRSSDLHPSNLIQTCIHVLHELQHTLFSGLEYGYRVPARVEVACIAVRDVDMSGWEDGVWDCVLDLCACEGAAGGWVRRDDGEIGDEA